MTARVELSDDGHYWSDDAPLSERDARWVAAGKTLAENRLAWQAWWAGLLCGALLGLLVAGRL